MKAFLIVLSTSLTPAQLRGASEMLAARLRKKSIELEVLKVGDDFQPIIDRLLLEGEGAPVIVIDDDHRLPGAAPWLPELTRAVADLPPARRPRVIYVTERASDHATLQVLAHGGVRFYVRRDAQGHWVEEAVRFAAALRAAVGRPAEQVSFGEAPAQAGLMHPAAPALSPATLARLRAEAAQLREAVEQLRGQTRMDDFVRAMHLLRQVDVSLDQGREDINSLWQRLRDVRRILERWTKPLTPPPEEVFGLLEGARKMAHALSAREDAPDVKALLRELDDLEQHARRTQQEHDSTAWASVADRVERTCEHVRSRCPSRMGLPQPETPEVLAALRRHVSGIESTLIAHGRDDDPAVRAAIGRARAAIDAIDPAHADALERLQHVYAAEVRPLEALASRSAPTPEMPPVSVDRVHFAIMAPRVMIPGDCHELSVWAHLEHQRQEVVQRAREEAANTDLHVKSQGPVRVARGTVLTVRVRVTGLTIDPPEQTILWEAEIGSATFVVAVPGDAIPGTRKGVATVRLDGHRIATIHFVAEIGTRRGEPDRLPVEDRRFHRAFISYASEDNDAVLARIQGMQKMVRDWDPFFARASISSGEFWQKRLERELREREILYLFWSEAASRSRWVDWEWRFGLAHRGIEFIDPVPLVSPRVVPPPDELVQFIHFDDWMLAYMNRDEPPQCEA